MGRNCAYTPETLFVVTDGQQSQKREAMATCRGVKKGVSDEYILKPMVRSDSCTSTITVNSSASLPCIQLPVLQRSPISSPSPDQIIRSRFLNRLGFTTQPKPEILHGAHKQRSQVSSVILRGKEFTFQNLKGDHGQEWKNDNRSNIATTPSRRRPLAVSFDEAVKVHSIPKHTEYSDRIRDQLWVKASVQQKNMARNCIEFAAEGWNWEHVEEEMIVLANGEKVHPIHLSNQQNNLGWRFCAARAMQQRQHK